MARKKSNKRMYFDEDVQNAIIEYNSSDNYNFRNKIYRDKIHAAFDKLCENIINTFKFSYFDEPFTEVKNSVVAFLVMNIHKYENSNGFRNINDAKKKQNVPEDRPLIPSIWLKNKSKNPSFLSSTNFNSGNLDRTLVRILDLGCPHE